MIAPDEPAPHRPSLLGASFEDVVVAARADAGWAYRRLFETYAPAVAGYLRGQGAEDPDGLANDVFLRAFSNVARFEGDEDRFRSWLFTIAHHALVDDRRRRSRRPVLADADLPDVAGRGADDAALEQLGTERLRSLLAELSPDQRDVLLLRILADLTIEQIAGVMGKRAGAVKQLQRRALATLRRRLEETGDHP